MPVEHPVLGLAQCMDASLNNRRCCERHDRCSYVVGVLGVGWLLYEDIAKRGVVYQSIPSLWSFASYSSALFSPPTRFAHSRPTVGPQPRYALRFIAQRPHTRRTQQLLMFSTVLTVFVLVAAIPNNLRPVAAQETTNLYGVSEDVCRSRMCILH